MNRTFRLTTLFLHRFLIPLLMFMGWLSCGIAPLRAQSVSLLKDIMPDQATDGKMKLGHFYPIGNKVLLTGYSEPDGYNPWIVNVGSQSSAMLVAYSKPANNNSGTQYLAWRGHYYFHGSNFQGVTGSALWQTDLSASSTQPLVTLPTMGYTPRAMVPTDSAIVSFWGFYYLDRLIVVRSDGTQSGTWRVDSLGVKVDSTQIQVIGNKVAFVASGALHLTDGNPGVQSIDLWPGGNEDVRDLVAFDGKFWFSANDSVHGRELWVSNGTVAGTHLYEDYNPGPADGIPGRGRIATTGHHLYWASDDGGIAHGKEIRMTDGSNQSPTLLEQVAGPQGHNTTSYAAAGNRVYMKDASINRILIVDSTGIDTLPTYTFQNYPQLPVTAAIGDTLLVVYDGFVYRIDGTYAGTYPLVTPQVFGAKIDLRGRGDTAYFAINQFGLSKLYRTDGSLNGTVQVNPFAGRPSSSKPHFLGRAAHGVVFMADSPGNGRGLWRTDGTPAGTSMLINLIPWGGSITVIDSVMWQDNLYLSVEVPNSGYRLLRTDGTSSGTQLLWSGTDFIPDSLYVDESSGVYFSGENLSGQQGVWHTDGTPNGTAFWARAQVGGSYMQTVIGHNAHWILIGVRNNTSQISIWACDRNAGGLHQVVQHQDVYLGHSTSIHDKILYFTNDNSWSGNLSTIYATTGDSGSIAIGSFSLHGNYFPHFQDTAAGKVAFSISRMNAAGAELMFTDGTQAGTVGLVGTGGISSMPYGEVSQVDDQHFYFLARDAAQYGFLYQSDGTPSGTAVLGPVCPGENYGMLQRGMWIGTRLHLPFYCYSEGDEILAADLATGSLNQRIYWPGKHEGILGMHGSSEQGVLLSGASTAMGSHPLRYNLGTFTPLPDPVPGPQSLKVYESIPWGNGFVLSAECNAVGHELYFVDSMPSVLLQEPEARPRASVSKGIVVFPVPAREHLSIRLVDEHDLLVGYELLDIAGRSLTLHSIPATAEAAVDLAGIPSGIYLLRARLRTGEWVTERVVVGR
ncbi:MAG: hypothetical protein U0176_18225 [Bacteroidia bacterium]